MSVTLDASVGTTTANSFIDQATAQAIMDATPNVDAWTDASSPARDVALMYATALLNTLAYEGVKSDFDQALQWPRYAVRDPDYGESRLGGDAYLLAGQWGYYLDTTKIPRRIQRGTVMLALEILRAGTSDVWGVDLSLEVAREVVDVLSTEYVPPWFRRAGLKRYPSVWREIAPLLVSSGPLRVERA